VRISRDHFVRACFETSKQIKSKFGRMRLTNRSNRSLKDVCLDAFQSILLLSDMQIRNCRNLGDTCTFSPRSGCISRHFTAGFKRSTAKWVIIL
jgi:hypothetical protein